MQGLKWEGKSEFNEDLGLRKGGRAGKEKGGWEARCKS